MREGCRDIGDKEAKVSLLPGLVAFCFFGHRVRVGWGMGMGCGVEGQR